MGLFLLPTVLYIHTFVLASHTCFLEELQQTSLEFSQKILFLMIFYIPVQAFSNMCYHFLNEKDNSLIHSIQVYRGIAAILVVLFHANLIMGKYFEKTSLTDFFSFGHSGVNFFFVLSGFIMYFVHNKDFGKLYKLSSFFRKRIIRIYPIYWIITLIISIIFFVVPSFGEPYHKELPTLVKSLILIPQIHCPVLTVGWTLTYEMMFYLIFSVLIIHSYLGQGIVMIWTLSILGSLILGIEHLFPYSILFSPYNLLFIMGILAAKINQAMDFSHPKVLRKSFIILLSGIVLFVLTGIFENICTLNKGDVLLYYGFASSVILILSNHPKIENAFQAKPVLLLTGAASYSIYLIHYPVLSLTAKLLVLLNINKYLSNSVLFILILSIAILSGILLYLIIEKPLLNYLRRNYNKHQMQVNS
jgi:exopolysaccharide production protein ExoZ